MGEKCSKSIVCFIYLGSLKDYFPLHGFNLDWPFGENGRKSYINSKYRVLFINKEMYDANNLSI